MLARLEMFTMQCATVLYPNKPDAKFDFDYYIQKHVPMVSRLLQTSIEVRKGVGSISGSSAQFVCVATIWVASMPQFQAAMAQHGAQIMGDIPNYTNIEPVVQLDEVLVEGREAAA